MSHSTLAGLLLATPFAPELLPLAEQLLPLLAQLGQLVQTFCRVPVTPTATDAFEKTLAEQARQLALTTLAWTANHLEPADPTQSPDRLAQGWLTYRRRPKSPNTVACLFGEFTLQRLLYEPLEPGERCLAPLEQQLGIVAGNATPALAQRVGQLTLQQSQRATLQTLGREHDVHWSHDTLRKVTKTLAGGLSEHRQDVQVQRLLGWLEKAEQSTGPYRPALAVGRDGIHVPMSGGSYNEGSTATVSVFDRRGKRLGTVYLGRMPQEKQETLSQQLTGLIGAVLQQRQGTPPRLAYITDGGWHPTDYFVRVLRKMPDPRRPGQYLQWERVIDFYHAALYVTQLAEALFGPGQRAQNWARRMRRLLKQKNGVTRLLQSAAYHKNQENLNAARAEAYRTAYNYLQKRRKQMNYARYRRLGVPRGSGITEAGCKIVFTQRLKQSGMRWERPGGQVIVDLRVLWLSGIWEEVHQAFLQAQSARLGDTTTWFLGETERRAS
jgi:hypothetical protein